MNSISAKNIFFYFNKYSRKIFCLNDISFDVSERDFISILGPNGSGKTTLVKILVQLIKQKKGELFLYNQNFNKFPIKEFYKNVSFVPQSFNCIFPFTVFEIILMGRTPYFNKLGFENEKDIKIVLEIMEQLEITPLKDKSINEISGGELQRVIIARAIVQETNILILDEPNSHLDIKHQIFIFDLLKELNNKGKTIIIISHDLTLSMIYSNRIIYLKGGNILFDGIPKDASDKNLISEVYEIDYERLYSGNQSIYK